MERERSIADIDESLVERLATFSRGGQRWLKTAIQTIVTSDLLPDANEAPQPKKTGRRSKAPPAIEPPPAREPASLEDVITGKADLREHLEAYPELQDELEGLADVIDLLREAGEKRRQRGEQILREEILGRPEEKPEDEDEAELA
jgi:hypothetical protein